ncbi:MAG: YaaL family protein [Oscillospiraceae bacterium]|jgi:hypothetical protein|nr:YaaL family protein [Oscillospiraceae bacterium]
MSHRLFRKKQDAPADPAAAETANLIEEIRDCCRQMDNVVSLFELESDDDLIEAAIYQMNALKARYAYLTKQARERNMRVHIEPETMSDYA